MCVTPSARLNYALGLTDTGDSIIRRYQHDRTSSCCFSSRLKHTFGLFSATPCTFQPGRPARPSRALDFFSTAQIHIAAFLARPNHAWGLSLQPNPAFLSTAEHQGRFQLANPRLALQHSGITPWAFFSTSCWGVSSLALCFFPHSRTTDCSFFCTAEPRRGPFQHGLTPPFALPKHTLNIFNAAKSRVGHFLHAEPHLII